MYTQHQTTQTITFKYPVWHKPRPVATAHQMPKGGEPQTATNIFLFISDRKDVRQLMYAYAIGYYFSMPKCLEQCLI